MYNSISNTSFIVQQYGKSQQDGVPYYIPKFDKDVN